MQTLWTSWILGLTALLLALNAGSVQANFVNFTLTGNVIYADSGNGFNLSSETQSVSLLFEDSVLSGGSGVVSFGNGSGNTLSVVAGSYSFVESEDNNFATGFPQLTLSGGAFSNMNFAFNIGTFGYLDSTNLGFDGDDDNSGIIGGTWGDFSTSPVPLPATLWLFSSGLLGMVAVARRK
jgi:hypothetical protein